MVSDIAGTTRDAIDTEFEDNGERFVIIDTAGIRKRKSIEYQSLERFSVVRSLAAIDRCDVALLLIDATQGVSVLVDAHDNLVINQSEDGRLVASCGDTWAVAVDRGGSVRWETTLPSVSARSIAVAGDLIAVCGPQPRPALLALTTGVALAA